MIPFYRDQKFSTAHPPTSKHLVSDAPSSRFYQLLLYAILAFALIYRLINLNYNVAFVDEASSIVIGQLGVFQGDWWSYNASNWLSGSPYINPILSALAFVTGGISGSRFLSVVLNILNIEVIAVITLLLSGFTDYRKYVAALISAAILAISPVSYFVSRLATYDIKSFYFLFLSILILIWVEKTSSNPGKWYFLAFVTLMLAFLSKIIIAIYIPFIAILSGITAWKNPTNWFFWKRYFIFPLVLSLTLYSIVYVNSITTFAKLQESKETFQFTEIIKRIFSNIPGEWLWALLGTIGMLTQKKYWLTWLVLSFFAVWVLVSHLVTERALWTMDKHMFITAGFLSIISGIGITQLLSKIRIYTLKVPIIASLFTGFYIFAVTSYPMAQKYNSLWDNSSQVSHYLTLITQPGDRILSEIGPAVMLDLYSINSPLNTTTFDWFSYKDLEGTDAYVVATQDGYFNSIQLISSGQPKSASLSLLSELVRDNLISNYSLTYTDDRYEIYRRKY